MNTAPIPVSAGKTNLLDSLVTEVRAIVRRSARSEITAHLVGERLGFYLGQPALLTVEQSRGDTRRYRQHVLHVEPDGSFSVVALVWLPGQRTAIHDHLTWCVVGVHAGEETERRYRIIDGGEQIGPYLQQSAMVVNAVGDICGFAPPGDVHEVVNSSAAKTISIHIYGADIARLGSSIRRVYDLPKRW